MSELKKSEKKSDNPNVQFVLDKYHDDLKKLRITLVYMAKVAERAERYDDMAAYMGKVAQIFPDLKKGERDLLIIGYKQVLGNIRKAWKSLSLEEDEDEFDEHRVSYHAKVQARLIKVCTDGATIFETIAQDKKKRTAANKVFFLKTAADYYRYLAVAQRKNKADSKKYGKKAIEGYKEAMTIAESKLPPTAPILLDTALHYSVCVQEILKETKQACFLAKTAFDAAISKLDDLDDDTYKDSTLIMQLLRDNLTLWTKSRERSRRSHHR